MSCYSDLWPIIATSGTEYPILINFRQVRLKWVRTAYDASLWQILHNMASSGPMLAIAGNGQPWSRISSLNELVHFKAVLKDLGVVYQFIARTALWDNIGQICSKVAYNDPIFVIVWIYNRLGPYMSLY